MTKRKATKNKGVLPESTQPVAEIQNDDLDFSFLIEEDPIGAKNSKDEYVDPNDDFTINGLEYDWLENSVKEYTKLKIEFFSSYSESVREELVEVIASIRKIKAENYGYQFEVKKDRVLGYSENIYAKSFYVPCFLLRLLEEYGFEAEVSELEIKEPDINVTSDVIRFRKDLILSRKDGSFVFACCFRRSLKNFLDISISYGHLPWRFPAFIEGLYNDNSCNNNLIKCDEESIRTLDVAEVSLLSYERLNNKIYEDCKIRYK